MCNIENCALLGYYTARSGNSLPTFRDNLSVQSSIVNNPNFLDSWPLKMGPIGCPETSVRNYHLSLCNSLEERGPHLLGEGSLTSQKKTVSRVKHCPRATGCAAFRWSDMNTPAHGTRNTDQSRQTGTDVSAQTASDEKAAFTSRNARNNTPIRTAPNRARFLRLKF